MMDLSFNSLKLSTVRSKLADMLRPQPLGNAAPVNQMGREYATSPNYYDDRQNCETLLAVSEVGQIDRIMWEIYLLIFNGWGMKALPPEDTSGTEQKSLKVLKQLWKLDKTIQTRKRMGQTFADVPPFGASVHELGWGRLEGWKAPEYIAWLDASSFEDSATHGTGNNRWVEGRLLKGICYDTQEKAMEYWQTQPNGTVLQIPTDRVLHVKPETRYADGESYLSGIVPTVKQLEFSRKTLMQFLNRQGAPTMGLRIKELKGPNGQVLPNPYGKKDKTRFKLAEEQGAKVLKNYGKDNAFILWEEMEPVWLTQAGSWDPTKPDRYFKEEILQHLIPRDFVEQNGQAVSKSSQPLQDLLMLVVQGWRGIIAEPWELMWTQILELNGFEGWSVEFLWKDLDLKDHTAERQIALDAAKSGFLTVERLYEIMGWKAPTEKELAIIQAQRAALVSAAPAANSLQINADDDEVLGLLQAKGGIATDALKAQHPEFFEQKAKT